MGHVWIGHTSLTNFDTRVTIEIKYKNARVCMQYSQPLFYNYLFAGSSYLFA